jgi:hypothetical protein
MTKLLHCELLVFNEIQHLHTNQPLDVSGNRSNFEVKFLKFYSVEPLWNRPLRDHWLDALKNLFHIRFRGLIVSTSPRDIPTGLFTAGDKQF